MPKLHVSQLENKQTIKLEITSRKHTIGHLVFDFQVVETKPGWFSWSATTERQILVSLPNIKNQRWDSQSFEGFLDRLKREQTGMFLVGDQDAGLTFYSEEGYLVFGYGAVNSEHLSGLDTEFRIKLGEDVITELEKLTKIMHNL